MRLGRRLRLCLFERWGVSCGGGLHKPSCCRRGDRARARVWKYVGREKLFSGGALDNRVSRALSSTRREPQGGGWRRATKSCCVLAGAETRRLGRGSRAATSGSATP